MTMQKVQAPDERYQRGKIYYLECLETGEIYVGSTIVTKSERLQKHRSEARLREKRGCSSKQIIDRGNYRMVVVEYYPCWSKQELCAREEVHRLLCVKAINKVRCFMTEEDKKKYKADWFQRNYVRSTRQLLTEEEKKANRKAYREEHKEEDKSYRESRKEIQAALGRKHYLENREAYLERSRKRAEEKKDEIAAQRKEYYGRNREAIRAKQKEAYARKKQKKEEEEKESH